MIDSLLKTWYSVARILFDNGAFPMVAGAGALILLAVANFKISVWIAPGNRRKIAVACAYFTPAVLFGAGAVAIWARTLQSLQGQRSPWIPSAIGFILLELPIVWISSRLADGKPGRRRTITVWLTIFNMLVAWSLGYAIWSSH